MEFGSLFNIEEDDEEESDYFSSEKKEKCEKIFKKKFKKYFLSINHEYSPLVNVISFIGIFDIITKIKLISKLFERIAIASLKIRELSLNELYLINFYDYRLNSRSYKDSESSKDSEKEENISLSMKKAFQKNVIDFLEKNSRYFIKINFQFRETSSKHVVPIYNNFVMFCNKTTKVYELKMLLYLLNYKIIHKMIETQVQFGEDYYYSNFTLNRYSHCEFYAVDEGTTIEIKHKTIIYNGSNRSTKNNLVPENDIEIKGLINSISPDEVWIVTNKNCVMKIDFESCLKNKNKIKELMIKGCFFNFQFLKEIKYIKLETVSNKKKLDFLKNIIYYYKIYDFFSPNRFIHLLSSFPDQSDEKEVFDLWFDIANFLMKNGVDINKKYCSDYTPFQKSCLPPDNIKICKFFLLNGANINVPSSVFKEKEYPIHLTCKIYYTDNKLLQILLQKGDIDKRNIYGETPLSCCCKNGHHEYAVELVENNANINAKDKNEETPLTKAILNSFFHIAEYLILRKGELSPIKKEDFKFSLLRVCRFIPTKLSVVKALLDSKMFEIYKKDVEELFLIHLSVKENNLHLLKFFINGKYFDINSPNKEGKTALEIAKKNKSKKIINFLQAVLGGGIEKEELEFQKALFLSFQSK